MLNENTFEKGMSPDISYAKPQNNTYVLALDMRPYNRVKLSEGAMMNFKGTKPVATLPNRTTEVIGSIDVKDGVVIFTIDTSNDESSVWKLSSNDGGLSLIYSDIDSISKLNFSVENRIHGTSKKDSEFSEKIYWTDGVNQVRSMNILEDLTGKEASYFDMYPMYKPLDITISIGGSKGTIETGRVQYFARYFNKYGAESSISGWSKSMILVDSNDNSSFNLEGTPVGESSYKSVDITINNIDKSFSHISIYRILYTDIIQAPTITLVSQMEIFDSSELTITDAGNNDMGILTVEEFNALIARSLTANAMDSHKNVLMIGGITDKYFDVDIDARAYSFSDHGGTTFGVFKHRSNGKYGDLIVYPNGDWSIDGCCSGINFEGIPTDHDCINEYTNLYAHIDKWKSNMNLMQMYQNDALDKFGGIGKVVSYELDKRIDRFISNKEYPASNKLTDKISFSAHKRGEVYRYGIVFYSKSGLKSSVKWITDIIIPYDAFEPGDSWDRILQFSSINFMVFANDINITFNINFGAIPEDIRNELSYAQIVRVERKGNDITSVNGYITRTTSFAHSDFSNNFSFVDWGFVYPGSILYQDLALKYSIGYQDFNDVTYSQSNDASNFLVFHSPDVSVNDFTPVGGRSKMITTAYHSDPYDMLKLDRSQELINVVKYYSAGLFPDTSGPELFDTITINDASIIGASTGYGSVTLGSKSVTSGLILNGMDSSYMNPDGGTRDKRVTYCNSPKSLIVNVDGAGRTDVLFDYNYVPVVDIVNDNYNSRYGGNTVVSRYNNVYVPVSEFIDVTSGIVNVDVEGDIFNAPYEEILGAAYPFYPAFDESMVAEESDDGYEIRIRMNEVATLFPIESMVNCNVTETHAMGLVNSNSTYPTALVIPYDNMIEYMFIQEIRDLGIERWPDKYPTDLPEYTYTYNTVYSKFPSYPESVTLNPMYDISDRFPSTVYASRPSSQGAIIDNWTKFDVANDLNVGNENGEIFGLKSFNNRLYYFQDNAFGIIASNERSTVTDAEGAQLALGSGGVLERFDVIMEGVGIQDPLHVIAGNKYLMFIDINRAQLIDASAPFIPVGDVHRNASITGRMISNIKDKNDVALGYDPIYKEYLFTMGGETLVFSELFQHFTSMYSAVPNIYLNCSDSLFSFINYEDIGTKRYIFEHNKGFYGDVYKEVLARRNEYAFITFLLNPNGVRLVEPNNIIYRADVFDGTDPYETSFPRNDRTIKKITVRNHYAEVDTPIYLKTTGGSQSNTSNIAGEWRTQLNLTRSGNRMAAPYQLITLNFDNTQNEFILLHSVITDFMVHNV